MHKKTFSYRSRHLLTNSRGSLLITILLAFAGLMCVNIAIQGAGVGDYVQTWPQVEGKVLTAEIGTVSYGIPKKEREVPRVTYTYEVGGESFEGDKVLLSDGPYEEISARDGSVHVVFRDLEDKAVALDFAAGGPVTVHHNPERPEEAVLHPYVPAGLRSFWIIGIAMISIAVLLGCREMFSG